MKKNVVISFILGALLFSSITGVLAYKLGANQVSYDPEDENWSVQAVDTALDDLYDMATYGDATANDIVEGKTALVNGTQITGTLDTSSISSGSHSESILWQNADPTAVFAPQNVTLSDSISNYSYIKITYRARITETNEFSVYMSVNDFKNTSNDLFWLTGSVSWGSQWPNSPSDRQCKYVDDTTINFLQNYGGPSNQVYNGYVVPYIIYGITGGLSSNSTQIITTSIGNTTASIAIIEGSTHENVLYSRMINSPWENDAISISYTSPTYTLTFKKNCYIYSSPQVVNGYTSGGNISSGQNIRWQYTNDISILMYC